LLRGPLLAVTWRAAWAFAAGAEIDKTDVVKFDATSPTPGGDAREARESRTRDAVARLLLEQGPTTAAALGDRLGLSTPAVRRHLDALIAEGLVSERDQRPLGRRPRGRGRPAKVFALTGPGRESFPHAYDDLAAAAIRFLAEVGGEAAVSAFAARRVAVIEERHGAAIRAAGEPAQRLDALAGALSGEGYAASAHALATGGELCQHHCPVAHVAAEFPQLCEAETRAFERLLGTHVQRLATLARGDEVCTTHVPAAVATRRSYAPRSAGGSTAATSTTSTDTITTGSGRKPA
jgi:predicted ArsR family transcriptional regulator